MLISKRFDVQLYENSAATKAETPIERAENHRRFVAKEAGSRDNSVKQACMIMIDTGRCYVGELYNLGNKRSWRHLPTLNQQEFPKHV